MVEHLGHQTGGLEVPGSEVPLWPLAGVVSRQPRV